MTTTQRARRISLRCVLVLCSLSFPALSFPTLSSPTQRGCPSSTPWSRLPETGAELIGPRPLLLGAGAITAPLVMAPSGLDHELRLLSQRRLGGRYDPEPVSVLAPYVLAGGLVVGYGMSAALAACDWQKPQAAMLQAVILTTGTVALLKWTTGRTWPNGGGDPTASNRLDHPEWATRFRPFREGLAAWPSGHTAVMVAAAAALRSSSPELGWLRWLGYPLAAGVAAGMWLGDHHWASDILSGALLGEAVGGAVGQSFNGTAQTVAVSVLPQTGGWLLAIEGQW